MKCPYCNYIMGWDNETDTAIEDKEGAFYIISNNIKMIKEDEADNYIVGCPKCNKLFMD